MGDLHCLKPLTLSVKRTKEQTTDYAPIPKNDAIAGYHGPVEIEL